jgi:hypothetical protein
MEKVSSYQRNKSHAPEIRIFKGPSGEAVTGDGAYTTLFGSYWAATRLERVLSFYKLEAGQWVLKTSELLPLGAKHIAAGFDGSARRVWAYEVQGQIYIRQWENLVNDFVVRGPFAGYDPLILNDANRNRTTNDSDSILIHLSSDRSGVITRLERDDYGVAHSFATLSGQSYLDQGYFANGAMILFGESQDESPLFMRSGPYPFGVLEQARVGVTLLDWLEVSNLIQTSASDSAGVGVSLLNWLSETISLNRTASDQSAVTVSLQDWTVTLILVNTQTVLEQAKTTVTLQDWTVTLTTAGQYAPFDQANVAVTLQNWTVA